MARNKVVHGHCHICGYCRRLTFEHIPPKAAFNRYSTIAVPFSTAMLGPDARPRGKTEQGGVGDFTLCDRCNSNTGSWYAPSFVDWCYQAVDLLRKMKTPASVSHSYDLRPLRVIKQIVAMLLSVNSLQFRERNKALADFVLNRDHKHLPPKYRVYCYLNLRGWIRQIGLAAWGTLDNGMISMLTELSYPPLGCLLTIDSDPPDKRVREITYFAGFDYNDRRQLSLDLPLLETGWPYPGVYGAHPAPGKDEH